MKFRLRCPDSFKFIQIVLSIENYILQALVWILVYNGNQILPYSYIIEIQFFTSIADIPEISAGPLKIAVDLLQDDCKFLQA